MSGGLDFVVIGAQKAATTTLYHWLREHPALVLPDAKESAFFDRLPAPTQEDYDRFLGGLFPARDGRLRGKATPQYMCFPWSADAMAALEPQLRLVAILRDPVERARSHWSMRVRMGTESRPFERAVGDLLVLRGDERREEDGYLAFGEYGRVLTHYLTCFGRDQLLVLDDMEMSERPAAALTKVCAHLGVATFAPSSFTVRFNAGPTGHRAVERALWKLFPHRLAQRALPERLKIRLGAELDRRGVRRPPVRLDPALTEETTARLAEFYRTDAQLLTPVLGQDPYWLARRAAQ